MATGPSGKSVGETLESTGRPLRSVALAGLETLDNNATLTFTLYRRMVLPADGFVFWVRADQLSASALNNTSPFNTAGYNTGPNIVVPAAQFDASGSLHHATSNTQDEDANFSIQRMVFTSEVPVNELNDVAPGCMWIADWDQKLRFAFSSRNFFYQQAGLFHYSGDALYSTMSTQVIDNIAQMPTGQIVSNSLPIWLTLATRFPLYPSFLVPDNVQYPYGAVHIADDDTSPLGANALHDITGSRWQLMMDRVKVSTYGVNNDLIMDWIDDVERFTVQNVDTLGIMGPSPFPRDSKKTQVEFGTLAQRKETRFNVSYYQQRIRDRAAIYIKKAFLSQIYPQPTPPPASPPPLAGSASLTAVANGLFSITAALAGGGSLGGITTGRMSANASLAGAGSQSAN